MTPDPLTTLATQTAEKLANRLGYTRDGEKFNMFQAAILEALQTALAQSPQEQDKWQTLAEMRLKTLGRFQEIQHRIKVVIDDIPDDSRTPDSTLPNLVAFALEEARKPVPPKEIEPS